MQSDKGGSKTETKDQEKSTCLKSDNGNKELTYKPSFSVLTMISLHEHLCSILVVLNNGNEKLEHSFTSYLYIYALRICERVVI